MLVKNIDKTTPVPVEMEGAKDVTVRVMIGPKDAAPNFAMRLFELAPGGNTPYHTHPFEHEVIVMAGNIALVSQDKQTPMTFGDVALVPPDEIHQFKNISDTQPARMICLVLIEYQP